jgi:hypothetical protein
MKRSTILIVLLVILFARCKSGSNNDVSGIYTNESKSEYSIASDTLIITLVTQTENIYQIQSRTGYQIIKNKALLPKQYKQMKWEATYDSQKKTLSEGDLGIQIRMATNRNSLFMKSTEYQKVK